MRRIRLKTRHLEEVGYFFLIAQSLSLAPLVTGSGLSHAYLSTKSTNVGQIALCLSLQRTLVALRFAKQLRCIICTLSKGKDLGPRLKHNCYLNLVSLLSSVNLWTYMPHFIMQILSTLRAVINVEDRAYVLGKFPEVLRGGLTAFWGILQKSDGSITVGTQ